MDRWRKIEKNKKIFKKYFVLKISRLILATLVVQLGGFNK